MGRLACRAIQFKRNPIYPEPTNRGLRLGWGACRPGTTRIEISLPASLIGDLLALVALAVVLFAAWVTWRTPFLGLGALVAGMAFHNFLIMALVKLGTSHLLIRIVQSWKEGILALLVLIAALRLYRAYREGRNVRPSTLDYIALVFLAVMVLYLVLPSSALHGHTNFQQRLAAFRLAAYSPVLYAFGRTFEPPTRAEISKVAWLIVGAGAVVGAFGLFELWLVPTRTWVDWGVNDFSAWLGFQYSGPGHLPENFFQTLPSGLYLRRMVSTYLSPRGIAYTGLLAFPLAVAWLDTRKLGTRMGLFATGALILLLLGVLFSVTRLALFVLAGEAVLLALIMQRRWVTLMLPVLVAAIAVVLVVYPQVGPAVDANLVPGGPDRGTILSAQDPSFLEHMRTVLADAKVAAHHPLGEGLGSSGSTANRFGTTPSTNPDYAPGESAVLTTFVDTGVLGGLAYLALFLFGLVQSGRGLMRSEKGQLDRVLAMAAVVGGIAMIPITLTSDVWGDLSVLFLFWWVVGYASSLALRTKRLGPATT